MRIGSILRLVALISALCSPLVQGFLVGRGVLVPPKTTSRDHPCRNGNVPTWLLPTTTSKCRTLSSRRPDEEDEQELVRVRRGRRRDRYYDQDEDYYEDDTTSSEDDYYEDEDVEDEYWDKDEEDDDYDYDFVDIGEWGEHDLLGDSIIPNPLLDSMDPDGAADRFPELARDPRFWFDIVLFIAFLNFLSFTGPQDPFPDIPWY